MTILDVVLEGTVIEEYLTFATVRIPEDNGAHSRWLPVVCPRKDCGQEFLVNLGWKKLRRYRNPSTDVVTIFITKACPYCYKVSRIPRKYWPDFIKEKYDKSHATAREYYKTMITPAQIKKQMKGRR